jgi:hypothetical protein
MRRVFGCNLFDYLAANPEASANFNEAMVDIHGSDGAALVEGYDFSSFGTVVDLGGGTGTLLTTILQSNAHSHGILLDLPETLSQARRLVDACGFTERCDVVAGVFFKEVPGNHDVYILGTFSTIGRTRRLCHYCATAARRPPAWTPSHRWVRPAGRRYTSSCKAERPPDAHGDGWHGTDRQGILGIAGPSWIRNQQLHRGVQSTAHHRSRALLKDEHALSLEWLCFGQPFCLQEEPVKHSDFLLDVGGGGHLGAHSGSKLQHWGSDP